jgi:ligand-binding sensor domain-containing protein
MSGYCAILGLFIDPKVRAKCWGEFRMLLLISSWVAVAEISAAQQYTFIDYNIKQGLPQSQVRSIMQDSRGYIWAGTLNGLSRFDGNSFTNYDRRNGLLNNQINCITEFQDGSIIAGSNGSFAMINGLGITGFALPEGLMESTINVIHCDADLIWIGSENGLLLFDIASKKFVPLPAELNALSQSHIKAFLKRPADLLILTKEQVFQFDGENLRPFFIPSSTETLFFDIAASPNGQLWLASKGEGLIQLSANGEFIRNYSDDPDLPTTITGITVDHEQHLWLSSRFGFYEFDGTSFNAYTEKNGLEIPDVRDILEDDEGNIWLATYGGGISRFTGKIFTSFTTKNGLSSDAVMSVTQDLKGRLWFSTFDKGICLQESDSIRQFPLDELTDNNRIWSSLCDHSGAIWFGSSDGLLRCINDQFEIFTSNDSLNITMVLALFEDTSKRIWIGTQKGLIIYENGVFSSVRTEGAPKKKIRCIREDRAGILWFATIEGVFRFDGKYFTHFTTQDGLPENSTNCIEVDAFNRIWVGGQNGVAVLSGNKFVSTQVDVSSGSNVINFIRYYMNRIWAGTNNGLYSVVVDGSFREEQMSFRHYGLDDGLRSLETNLNAVFIDNKQNLWFGTTDGVTTLNTGELDKTRSLHIPRLNLEKIQINLLDQNWKQKFQRIDPLNGLALDPEFTHRDNHLTFYFSAISTTYPGEVEYQYMLEGLDEDWKTPTVANFATYSNLPYRNFNFKVRARTAGSAWSHEVNYPFSVKPPFWFSWWFIILEVLAASSIVFVLAYNKRKAITARREKEWFEIKSKLLALEQQSLNSSMNRHFIFNALNSIQYYINRQDRLAANKYLSDFARLIRKNLDSSQDNLTTLRDEVERLELYLKLEHMRFKDKFDYQIEIDPGIDLDRTKVPAMLVQPFLENSIWHGLLPKENMGHVKVNISQKNGYIEFMITDNGIGIENSLKNKTTADNHISKGMEITQNRIDLIRKTTGKMIELHGPSQISENTGAEGGTLVCIKIPIDIGEHFLN